MKSNTNLLELYYYIIQAHTTLRPGPTIRSLLEKAGIQELEPPSKAVLDKRLQDVYAQEYTPPSAPLYEKTPTPVLVQSGGAWYDAVYTAVDRFRNRNRNALTLFVTSMTLPLLFYTVIATRNREGQRNPELEEGLFLLEGMIMSLSAGGVAIATISGIVIDILEGDGDRFLRQAQQISAEDLDDPNRFSLLDIPSSGKLQMKRKNNAGEAIIDPVTFMEFQTGNKVAVIKNNRKAIILVDSLQAWIANPIREGPPKHPLTNEPFGKQDVKVYTLELRDTNVSSGGKRNIKRTRKTKKKY